MNPDPFELHNADGLLQRFIDDELSPEERLALLARLGSDRSLREHAMDLEHLAVAVRRLERPVVPDRFVEEVLNRLDSPPPARRWAHLLWQPRQLHWNLATAMAVAGLVAAVAGGLVLQGPSQPAMTVADSTLTSAASAVLVRLVVLQPDASRVEVAGDFNGWNPDSTPLEQTAAGAWTVTIPLEPGRYEYMFVVDGRWMSDPFAVEQTDDGFGSQNAVLDVRPPARQEL